VFETHGASDIKAFTVSDADELGCGSQQRTFLAVANFISRTLATTPVVVTLTLCSSCSCVKEASVGLKL
jgi:hypothetical protein